MVLRRQTKKIGAAAYLLEHGIGFLYVLAAAVFSIGIYRGNTSIARYFSLKQSEVILDSTVQKLKLENDRLTDEINRIKGSKSYARKVLREKYHVTDPDEKIVYYAD